MASKGRALAEPRLGPSCSLDFGVSRFGMLFGQKLDNQRPCKIAV